MGGINSTRWLARTPATTVEDCHTLDLCWLARQGAFQPGGSSGGVNWRRGERKTGSIGYVVLPDDEDSLRLILEYTSHHRDGTEKEEWRCRTWHRSAVFRFTGQGMGQVVR